MEGGALMVGQGCYGVRVYRFGFEFRGDGRRRIRLPGGRELFEKLRTSSFRGRIRGWTKASARRMTLVAANALAIFATHMTLTYRARAEAWEQDAERNRRVIRRSKEDLHRFLCCLRSELGPYLWVQEFQTRGVVHYHVLSERAVSQERATMAWCRASGQLEDPLVVRHGVRVQDVRHQRAARHYLGRYMGKEQQKRVPDGVDGAGRWWGRSRSLGLDLLCELVTHDRAEGVRRPGELQVARCLRRYVSKVIRGKFRGGMVLDWGGSTSAALQTMAVRLQQFFGVTPSVQELLEQRAIHQWRWAMGWELKALGNLPSLWAEERAKEAAKKLIEEALSKRRSGNEGEALLTSKQIAPFLGVTHHKTVERWVREKGLPCVHMGRNLRFRPSDVLRWVEQRKG